MGATAETAVVPHLSWRVATRRQPLHHPREGPHASAPPSTIAERLWRAMPHAVHRTPQARAAGEEYPAQPVPVIDTRLAMASRKERRRPLHLLVGRPEKVAHHLSHQCRGLNHAGREAPGRSPGADPQDNRGKSWLCRQASDGVTSNGTNRPLMRSRSLSNHRSHFRARKK
jgi:hypothetical protein